jgi:lysozyme
MDSKDLIAYKKEKIQEEIWKIVPPGFSYQKTKNVSDSLVKFFGEDKEFLSEYGLLVSGKYDTAFSHLRFIGLSVKDYKQAKKFPAFKHDPELYKQLEEGCKEVIKFFTRVKKVIADVEEEIEIRLTLLQKERQKEKQNQETVKKPKQQKVSVGAGSRNTPPPPKKSSNALSLYEGVKESDSVNESIDERILRLLGIDDVFDLDYGTYQSLLKARMIESRMIGKKLASEEDEILLGEYKRVRGKVGRFKVKKRKIKSENIGTTGPVKVSKDKFFLVGTAVIPQKQPKEDTKIETDNTSNKTSLNIIDSLKKIFSILSNQYKQSVKSSESERKSKERKGREEKENALESSIQKLSGAVKKIFTPVQGILDRIIKFITFTLLGRFVGQLLNWFGDPKNKKKVDALGRFLKDWWPTLLAAFVLFATPFGLFVRSFIGVVARFIPKLLGLIPKLRNIIKLNKTPKGPKGAGGLLSIATNPMFWFPAAMVGGAALGNEVTGQRKAAGIQAENKAKAQTGKGLGVQGVGGVGDMGPTTPYGLIQGASNGSSIFSGIVDKNTGTKISGAGQDTQYLPNIAGGGVAVAPGELVLTKEQQSQIAADTGVHPASYVPSGTKFVDTSKIQTAAGGGKIQAFKGGGIIGGIQNAFSNVGNFLKGITPGSRPASSTSSPKPSLPLPEFKLPEVQAALRTIKVAEGTTKSKNSYDTLFGFGSAPIRQMTVKEVISMQNTDRLPKRFGGGTVGFGKDGSGRVMSAAAGAYQFMPSTLQQLMNMKVLKPTDLMTPDNQDKGAWGLMKMRGVTLQSLRTSGMSRSNMNLMAPEWASFPNLQGVSNYNQPVKSPEVLQKTYSDTLKQLKLGPQSRATPPGQRVTTLPDIVRHIPLNTKSKPKNLRSHSSDVPDFEVLDMTRSAIDTRQKIKDSLGIG